MGTAIEKFLERAGEYTRQGKGFLTRCPAHNDANPSLFISENDVGDVLLVCRSQGCSFEAIVQGFGLSKKDAFHSNGSHEGRAPAVARGQGRPSGKVVAVFDYVDERNTLLYQVLRYDPKDFRQRRPNPKADPNVGEPWIWNIDGVRRVLYRLPEVVAARKVGHRIYVAEGEGKADQIAKLGLTGTSALGGANAPWLPQYTDALAGAREVVILPDNDKPGLDKANKIRDALAEWVTTVKVLDLAKHAELQEKDDVIDWVELGGTRDQLEALADAATPFIAPSQRFTAISVPVEEFMLRNYPKPRSLLGNGLICEGELAMIYGAAGLGKTYLLLQLALAWGRGDSLLEIPGPEGPVRVGILELETKASFLQDRIREIATDTGHEIPHGMIHIVAKPDLRGAVNMLSEDYNAVVRWCQELSLDVVIIDALSRAHDVDENKAVEIKRVLLKLDEISEETGSAIVAIHHEPKMTKGNERTGADAARGHSSLKDWCKGMLRLMSIKENEVWRLEATKMNNSPGVAPVYLNRPNKAAFHVTEYTPEKRKQENVDKVRDAIFHAGPAGITDKEIAQKTGLSERTAKRHRADLGAIQAGTRTYGAGKGKKSIPVWRLTDTDGQMADCPPVEVDVSQREIYD